MLLHTPAFFIASMVCILGGALLLRLKNKQVLPEGMLQPFSGKHGALSRYRDGFTGLRSVRGLWLLILFLVFFSIGMKLLFTIDEGYRFYSLYNLNRSIATVLSPDHISNDMVGQSLRHLGGIIHSAVLTQSMGVLSVPVNFLLSRLLFLLSASLYPFALIIKPLGKRILPNLPNRRFFARILRIQCIAIATLLLFAIYVDSGIKIPGFGLILMALEVVGSAIAAAALLSVVQGVFIRHLQSRANDSRQTFRASVHQALQLSPGLFRINIGILSATIASAVIFRILRSYELFYTQPGAALFRTGRILQDVLLAANILLYFIAPGLIISCALNSGSAKDACRSFGSFLLRNMRRYFTLFAAGFAAILLLRIGQMALFQALYQYPLPKAASLFVSGFLEVTISLAFWIAAFIFLRADPKLQRP